MKHKLQIEFIFEIQKKYTFNKFEHPIQNHPFKYGVQIKNIGDKVFSGAMLKDIRMHSKEHNTVDISNKEFSLPLLNPNDSTKIWVEPVTTYLTGLVWIDVNLVPNNIDDSITTYQKHKPFEQAVIYGEENKWSDVFFIRGENELQQARTNSYILILTALTFLQGAFGINKLLSALLEIIRNTLLYMADMI